MATKKRESDAAELINRFVQKVIIPRWEASGRSDKELAHLAQVAPAAISLCRNHARGLGIRSLPGLARAGGYGEGDGAVPLFWAAAEAWKRGDSVVGADGLVLPPPQTEPPQSLMAMMEDLKKETAAKLEAITGAVQHMATHAQDQTPKRTTTPLPQSNTRPSGSKIPRG